VRHAPVYAILDMLVGTELSSYKGDNITEEEFDNLAKKDIDYVMGPASNFFLWGSIAAFGAFLIGILFFIFSITIIGWVRSPLFGCLSGLIITVSAPAAAFMIWRLALLLKEKEPKE
jgi:hypothetical protein